MSRLIDADEATRLCAEEFDGVCVYDVSSSEVISDFEHIINSTPTVDAIPVVRCKDCKHLAVINKAPIYAICKKTNLIFYLWEEDTREHFCAFGERRTDGQV